MTIRLEVQYATNLTDVPDEKKIRVWASIALENLQDHAEFTIRIVDEKEGAQLNEQWGQSKGPTNVLSFTHEKITGVVTDLLGDIVICAPVVVREAEEQKKDKLAHWAHMVIHGILHLNGFDHINEDDAKRMENIEINILDKLNYKNPYLNH